MSTFTPISGSIGGSLIGFSAATLLVFNGDIMGCSGIITSIYMRPRETITSVEGRWKVVFVSTFLLTSKIIVALDYFPSTLTTGAVPVPLSDLGYCLAGLLVGIGTRLGNGCTSGHGICGLARRSKRSFAAVMTFMSTAIATASLWPADWTFGPVKEGSSFHPTASSTSVSNILIAGHFVLLALAFKLPSTSSRKVVGAVASSEEKQEEQAKEQVQVQQGQESSKEDYPTKAPVAALSSLLFSTGLYISGMINPGKIHGFLDVKLIPEGTWDATLATVMGCGLLTSALGYHFVKGHNMFRNERALECPLVQTDTTKGDTKTREESNFNIPTNTKIDRQLILGSAIFGIGWGLGSLCPGPALFLAVNGYQQVLRSWMPAMIIGSFLGEKAKSFF